MKFIIKSINIIIHAVFIVFLFHIDLNIYIIKVLEF